MLWTNNWSYGFTHPTFEPWYQPGWRWHSPTCFFFCLPYIWLADQVYILPIFSIPVSLFCNSIKINICTYHVLYQVVSSQYRNQQLYQDNIPLVGWLPEYPIGWFPKYLLSDPGLISPGWTFCYWNGTLPMIDSPKVYFAPGFDNISSSIHSMSVWITHTHIP